MTREEFKTFLFRQSLENIAKSAEFASTNPALKEWYEGRSNAFKHAAEMCDYLDAPVSK